MVRTWEPQSVVAAEAASTDPDLVAWASVAARVAEGLGPRGSLAVALLGESLTRPRPTPWFGYEPGADDLAELLAALGEGEVDTVSLLRAEEPLRGRHLGSVPASLVVEWRRRLTESAVRVVREAPLPARDAGHIRAEEVWTVAAPVASRPPLPVLDPDAALCQLRWYPGVATRTFVGYSDPLHLATVERATTEAGLTGPELDAQARARAVVEGPTDPLAWRLSSLAHAAERRPWEHR